MAEEGVLSLTVDQIRQIAAQFQTGLSEAFYERPDGTRGTITKTEAVKIIVDRFKDLAKLDFNDPRSWHEVIVEIQSESEQKLEANIPANLEELKAREAEFYGKYIQSGYKNAEARLLARIMARSGGETVNIREERTADFKAQLPPTPKVSREEEKEVATKFRSPQTEKVIAQVSERAERGPITPREGLTFLEKVIVPAVKLGYTGVGELAEKEETAKQAETPVTAKVEGIPAEKIQVVGELPQKEITKQVEGVPAEKTQMAPKVAKAGILAAIAPGVKNLAQDVVSSGKIYARRMFEWLGENWFATAGAIVGGFVGTFRIPIPVFGTALGAGFGWITGQALSAEKGGGTEPSMSQALPSGRAGGTNSNVLRNISNLSRLASLGERRLASAAIGAGIRGAAGALVGGVSTTTIAFFSVIVTLILVAGLTFIILTHYDVAFAGTPGQVPGTPGTTENQPSFSLTKKADITTINSLGGIKVVNFTVSIAAASDVTINSVTDETIAYTQVGQAPVANNLPDEINNKLIIPLTNKKVSAGATVSRTFRFEINTDKYKNADGTNQLSNSRLINTVTVIAAPISDPTKKETQSAGVTVTIGNPPSELCPLAPEGNECSAASLLSLPGINNNQTKAEKASRTCFAEAVNGPTACRCTLGPVENACSVTNLLPHFGNNQTTTEKASRVCYAETKGNKTEINDGCPTRHNEYSVGIFQINLFAHDNLCKQVLGGKTPFINKPYFARCKYPDCDACDRDDTLLKTCADYWSQSDHNIEAARQLSNNGKSWSAWSTAARQYCNIK